MIRFFTRLFASRTPARRPARRVSLSVEPLETRETPSGLLNPVHNFAHPIDGHPMSHAEKLAIKRNVLTSQFMSDPIYLTVSFSPHR
jgi:hypothetical protein